MIKETKIVYGYVCFLDLLGYSNFISKSTGQDDLLEQVLDLIKGIREEIRISNLRSEEYKNIKINTFSDNLFISMESRFKTNLSFDELVKIKGKEESSELRIELESIFYMIEVIKSIAKRIIEKTGLLVRGGLIRGEYYVNNTIVYGKALITSYEMESRKAIYPRIIIGDDIPKGLLDILDNDTISKFIYFSKDQIHSVNYLNQVVQKKRVYVKNENKFYEVHKALLTKNINEYGHVDDGSLELHPNQNRVLKKYIWVANYHNDYMNHIENIDMLINLEYSFDNAKNILSAKVN